MTRSAMLGATALAGALALMASPAAAQERSYDFDIPAQSLDTALRQYSRTTSQQLIFADADVRGRKAPALVGTRSAEEALELLLAGTDLKVRRTELGVLQVSADQGPQGGSAAGNAVQALIVTAQKREEDIQDVPIAISAFSQEDLTRSQIAGGPDLITQVPNMTFTKTNFTSYSIQLRGIGTQAISATTDPGVAVAFNNTPFIRNRFFEQEFYDLERVEVLRGPQGTLYGRNATAGVVNILSAKPKFYYEAKAAADIANYQSSRIEGMVNIPLVEDAVALRLAGAWTKRDGYATNEITGAPIDGRDLWSTRLSLRLAPANSPVDINLIWEHFEENDDRIRSGKQLCNKHVVTKVGDVEVTSFNQFLPDYGQGGFPLQSTLSQGCIRESLYSPNSFQTPNGLSVPYYYPLGYIGLPTAHLDPYQSETQSHDLRVIESIVDPKYRAKADLGELQISWDVTDNLTLASETAYSADFVWSMQDFNRFNTAEGAWGTPSHFVDLGLLDENGVFCDPQVGCSSRLVALDLSTGESRQFSQELRLSSDFDGPFNFSLGANFLRFDGEDKYYVFINSLTLSRAGDPFGSYDQRRPIPSIWTPGVSDNSECAPNGPVQGEPGGSYGYSCISIEPNSIENIQDYGHNYFLSRNPYRLISYAAFGEIYYNITETLKVTGGLRWTVDKKHAPSIPSWTLAGPGVSGYPVAEIIDQEWREPTGRLAVDWKPELSFTDETLLYASYGHGYKAGGANPPPMTLVSAARFGGTPPSVTRPKTFDAEFIDAFELGSKNTLADGRVTLNLAAFYYDYKDYQISEIVDRSAFNRNFDATIWGIEVEADWRPLENLKLSFKGGYENTAIADGEQAIDLMDRTAGNEDWVVVRPFPTQASSCVLPVYVFERPNGTLVNAGGMSGGNPGACEIAYLGGLDPLTELPYVADPPSNTIRFRTYPGYQGFDPLTGGVGGAHNYGEGFFKELGGNPLPNAPEFTATLSADYTLPLPNAWLATLHTDLYWQSESNWRVFDDHEFNRLDEYFTMNLAAIFTNEDAGWKVMAYVKNVFDRDSITGAFLNSDDTALTTNVFLTEPRLYGIRVTKDWQGESLLGSFGARRDGEYPFMVELGGQAQRHEAPKGTFTPSFMGEFSDTLDPRGDQQFDLDWGDGREVKLAYAPGDWKVSLGARFGKTNGADPWSQRVEEGDRTCVAFSFPLCQSNPGNYVIKDHYTISSTTDRVEHTLVEFMVGREFGFGGLDESEVSAGVRYGDLSATTSTHIFGTTNWDIPVEFNSLKYNGPSTWDKFDATVDAEREFRGAGPVLKWEAAKALLGNEDAGFLKLDWSVTGGVLFGERETVVVGTETEENFSAPTREILNTSSVPHTLVTTTLPPIDVRRSKNVTVPTYGASLGLSYGVDRMKLSAGYRWETYQDAIDGGYAQAQDEHRTIDGPYFKIAIGFGD